MLRWQRVADSMYISMKMLTDVLESAIVDPYLISFQTSVAPSRQIQ